MKRAIYKIVADSWGWDEYDAVVVIAKDSIEAKTMAQEYFEEHQLPLTYERICNCDAEKSEIVLTSFNAG